MKGPLALLANSLRRVRFLVLTLGVLMAGFQILLTLVAGSIERSHGFGDLSALIPDFMQQIMGPAFVGLMSFGGIVCVGYFHLAVMGSLIGLVIAVATEPAAEIESGVMDLILSRPIARPWVILRSVVLLVICTVFVLLMMMLGTSAGLRLLAPVGAVWPTCQLIRSLAINLGVLMFCWGGITLAISSTCRRRSIAGALAGVLALTTFLLDYVARAWEPAESVAWLSPFRYYSPLDLVTGLGIPAKNLWVLGGIGVAGIAFAYWYFSRRDI
ncbi:MAG: ABC transporter permease subunit [Acidobacteriota bacterium]